MRTCVCVWYFVFGILRKLKCKNSKASKLLKLLWLRFGVVFIIFLVFFLLIHFIICSYILYSQKLSHSYIQCLGLTDNLIQVLFMFLHILIIYTKLFLFFSQTAYIFRFINNNIKN